MRKCHLNTCPVGVATRIRSCASDSAASRTRHQFLLLRREEVRELMAAMGYAKFDQMIGQMQMLDQPPRGGALESQGARLLQLFYKPDAPKGVAIYSPRETRPQDSQYSRPQINRGGAGGLDRGAPVRMVTTIKNTDRACGAMLSGEIAKRYGHAGSRRHDPYQAYRHCRTEFRRLARPRVTLELEAKAMTMSAKAFRRTSHCAAAGRFRIVPEESIIVGNTVLYSQPMIARALNDGDRAGVADSKRSRAMPRNSTHPRGAIQHGIADNDGLLGHYPGIGRRPHNETSPERPLPT